MKNVVLYTRVANAKNITTDNETSVQEKELRNYCEAKGHNVTKVFTEVGLGRAGNQPKLNDLLIYVEKNKANIDMVIVTTWDRCSRDIEKTISILYKLEAMGIEVCTLNQNSEIGRDEHLLALYVYKTHQELLTAKNKI